MPVTTSVTPATTTGRAARRAMLSAWIGWMFDGYENYAFVLVMPIAMRQLVPPDQIDRVALYSGAVLAATLVGWATGGVIFGIVSDYLGRKRVLMLAILWYSVFSGLTYFASSYQVLMLCRFLTGLGLGAEWGAGAPRSSPSCGPQRTEAELQGFFNQRLAPDSLWHRSRGSSSDGRDRN